MPNDLPVAKSATTAALDDLISAAEDFGRVSIYGSQFAARTYHVEIEFRTSAGVQMSAHSEFKMPLREGLAQAINRARQIVAQMREG